MSQCVWLFEAKGDNNGQRKSFFFFNFRLCYHSRLCLSWLEDQRGGWKAESSREAEREEEEEDARLEGKSCLTSNPIFDDEHWTLFLA